MASRSEAKKLTQKLPARTPVRPSTKADKVEKGKAASKAAKAAKLSAVTKLPAGGKATSAKKTAPVSRADKPSSSAAKVAKAAPAPARPPVAQARPSAPVANGKPSPARAAPPAARPAPAAAAALAAQARRPMSSGVPAHAPVPQQAKPSLARSFYWSELRVGDDLPPLTKPAIDRVQIARSSAASGDFNPLHLDEPFAHMVGFPGVFAPGMLPMGFVAQLLSAWLRRGHVRRLSARFVKLAWPGDELTCRGRIAELRREQGACYADVELWAENQKGELVLRGQATCELYESPANGGGDGGGLLFALQAAPSGQPAERQGHAPRGDGAKDAAPKAAPKKK